MARIAYPYIRKNIELLQDVNVKNNTSTTYSSLIDFTDEHYKQISKKAKPIEEIDCSTLQKPNYW